MNNNIPERPSAASRMLAYRPNNLPLHNAVRSGTLNNVRRVLNSGVNTTRKNRNGKTAAELAANLGKHKALRMLTRHNGIPYDPHTVTRAVKKKQIKPSAGKILKEESAWMRRGPLVYAHMAASNKSRRNK